MSVFAKFQILLMADDIGGDLIISARHAGFCDFTVGIGSNNIGSNFAHKISEAIIFLGRHGIIEPGCIAVLPGNISVVAHSHGSDYLTHKTTLYQNSSVFFYLGYLYKSTQASRPYL